MRMARGVSDSETGAPSTWVSRSPSCRVHIYVNDHVVCVHGLERLRIKKRISESQGIGRTNEGGGGPLRGGMVADLIEEEQPAIKIARLITA